MRKLTLICQFRKSPLKESEQRAFRRRMPLKDGESQFVTVPDATAYPPLETLRAIIIGGSGELSLTSTNHPWYQTLGSYLRDAIHNDIPILGICFGHQFLASLFGSKVIRDAAQKEVGIVKVSLTTDGMRDPLFADTSTHFTSIAGHNDSVATLPNGWKLLASSMTCPIQAMRYTGHAVWGLQFHPELTPQDYRERLDYYRNYYLDAGVDIQTLYARGEGETNDNLILKNFYSIACRGH